MCAAIVAGMDVVPILESTEHAPDMMTPAIKTAACGSCGCLLTVCRRLCHAQPAHDETCRHRDLDCGVGSC